ncbi:hypothetical protein [Mycobacteroides immunogenum]|uniref:Uncharacterized protein n=1 Tax=Mycobacteroides immunogenum TaxID=83262 RepID=A0A7V8LLT1_9MYCO|nr:hypothetical protein [Mycobacteroides immunogenum]AMT69940.1 hypothetical protein ABG82_05905 [Mycobacteroides immunogenum]ANO02996.1 hypothetical protein BAB75_05940 [Mycobacteroides immunogenum]KIU37937.1 hypothetical protein TL11_25055 [Mycobacteroides immunogenum]KPG05467.1 hypothetical protein AN909_20890 [Mycobacteroides immunogenum]KPG06334.1 hypothetical protein AN908_21265 [Mycobacteroides immunogenum]
MKTAVRLRQLCATAVGVGALMALTPATALADDAQSVINQYQSQGYQVIIDRSGNGPTNKCTVSNIRNGQDVYRTEYQRTWMPSGKWLLMPVRVLDHRLVYISLNCNV